MAMTKPIGLRRSRELWPRALVIALATFLSVAVAVAPATGASLDVGSVKSKPGPDFSLDREDWSGAPSGWRQEASDEPEVGCFGDETGDVVATETGTSHPDPRADLLGHCAIYYDQAIAVGAVVDEPTDPIADGTWADGATLVYWEFDVNADSDVDFYLAYYTVDGEVRAFLRRPDHTEVCPGQGLGIYDEGLYIAAVPAACLGTPDAVSLASVMVYDDTSGSGYVVADSAPTGAAFDGPFERQLPPPQPPPVENEIPIDGQPPSAPDETPPSADPSEDPPSSVLPFDGDPATTERLDAADPTGAAIALSKMRFETAPFVVLSRNDIFADSLSGSSLTRDAPLLFTDPQALDLVTMTELARVAPLGTTVYVLGGSNAIETTVTDELVRQGYDVVRLAGSTRVETALAIAEELDKVYADGGDSVMIARAYGTANDETSGWADAISAGGVAANEAVPILLTPTEGLDQGVRDWLSNHSPAQTTLLGGTAALSSSVEAALPGSDRIAGPERTATAAAIATSLWDGPPSRFVLTSAYHEQGWAYGLAAAGLSADEDAPILLVGSEVSQAVKPLLTSCQNPQLETIVIGNSDIIGDDVVSAIDQLDGMAC